MYILIKKIKQISKTYLIVTMILLLFYLSMIASGEKINALPNIAIDQVAIVYIILKTVYNILNFKVFKKENSENIYTILIMIISIELLSIVNKYNIYEFCINHYSLDSLVMIILSIFFTKFFIISIIKIIYFIKSKINMEVEL